MYNCTYMKRDIDDIKKEVVRRGLKITERKDFIYFGILFAIEDLSSAEKT